MNYLKKRVSLILAIMMLALTILPLSVVTASSSSSDVSMSVKLEGTELVNKATYKVKGGEKVVVKAASNTGSTIAYIGYYYDEDGYSTMEDTYSDTITITVPTMKAGTKKTLCIEAVGANNTGVSDSRNRTGWQKYYLEWADNSSSQTTINGNISASYDGKALVEGSKTYATEGDAVVISATPANRVEKVFYIWDDSNDLKESTKSTATMRLPSEFAGDGLIHTLYIRARFDNGEYSPRREYRFVIGKSAAPVNPTNPTDDGLDVLPWEKENSELESLAINLRNDSESDKENKNIYAIGEEVTYYVDYKNGGKTITDPVTIKLELPLKFEVISADNGVVDTSKGTITWTYPQGMESEQEGTKTVVVKYTAFDKKSTEYKTIYPLATISKSNKVADESSVINLIYVDTDTTLDLYHIQYMYGDKNATTFRPDDTITRAEGALVLTRILLGQSAIDNVKISSVYPDLSETYEEAQKAIIAATSYGIINGYTDGYYRPNQTMTRAEFMKIIAKYIELNAEDEGIKGLEIKDISNSVKLYKNPVLRYAVNGTTVSTHWAIEEVTLLTRLNMTSASKNKDLRLDEGISRAEVAQLVNFYTFRAPAKITSRVTTQFSDVNRNHKLYADIVEATRASHEARFNEDGTEHVK